jgi:hypothetical protein
MSSTVPAANRSRSVARVQTVTRHLERQDTVPVGFAEYDNCYFGSTLPPLRFDDPAAKEHFQAFLEEWREMFGGDRAQ